MEVSVSALHAMLAAAVAITSRKVKSLAGWVRSTYICPSHANQSLVTSICGLPRPLEG